MALRATAQPPPRYPAYAKHSEAAPEWYGYGAEDIAPN
jgi:hypothetical protein